MRCQGRAGTGRPDAFMTLVHRHPKIHGTRPGRRSPRWDAFGSGGARIRGPSCEVEEKDPPMTRYLTRDRAAIAAAVAAPLAAAVILLPWRGSWSNTNVALLLVV